MASAAARGAWPRSIIVACRGQRWQNSYGSRYAYGQIPYSLRNRYDLNPNYRYYYDNGYLYQVDPRTLLVQQVISALLR
jgi:hypothetical protein